MQGWCHWVSQYGHGCITFLRGITALLSYRGRFLICQLLKTLAAAVVCIHGSVSRYTLPCWQYFKSNTVTIDTNHLPQRNHWHWPSSSSITWSTTVRTRLCIDGINGTSQWWLEWSYEVCVKTDVYIQHWNCWCRPLRSTIESWILMMVTI